ncbi:MAG: hypothetical protein ACOC1K_05955 [Nanoarchaeota archaeon]
MNEKQKEAVKEIMSDFVKYSRKLNEMMIISGGGKCPQAFKIMLMDKLATSYLNRLKEKDKTRYKEYNKTFNRLCKDLGLNVEELEAK